MWFKVHVLDLVSIPGLGRSPRGGHGNPLQYSCLQNPHGQKSLVGYSLQGHKKSDMTEQLSTVQLFHNHLVKNLSLVFWILFIFVGEGNGNPLEYSCLENPMAGGTWWAAVRGVTKSQTQLSDFTFTFHFPTLEKEMATYSSVLAWRIQGQRSLVGCRLWDCTESDLTELT